MTLERLFVGEKEILLIGTAHISAESVRLAQETILTEKPDVVGIELDEQRYHQLKNDSKWQSTDIGAVIKEGKTYLLLLNIFLSNLQRRLGESVSMKPGQEMIIAEQTATQNGIPVALLDRNIQVTMQRAFGLMPLMEKLRLGYYLLMGIFGGGTGDNIAPQKKQHVEFSQMGHSTCLRCPHGLVFFGKRTRIQHSRDRILDSHYGNVFGHRRRFCQKPSAHNRHRFFGRAAHHPAPVFGFRLDRRRNRSQIQHASSPRFSIAQSIEQLLGFRKKPRHAFIDRCFIHEP